MADGTTPCMSGDKTTVFVKAVSPKVHCAEFVLPGTVSSNESKRGHAKGMSYGERSYTSKSRSLTGG